MPFRHTLFIQVLQKLDQWLDDLRFRLIRVAGRTQQVPVKIATYRGFGRVDRVFLQGRVLIRKSIRNGATQATLRQLLDTCRNLNTLEIPRAKLLILIEGRSFELETDKEGYFTLDAAIDPPFPPQDNPWKSIQIELTDTPWGSLHAKTNTKILIPPPNAAFGIITDIDDTIVHTGLTSLFKWEAVYNTLFKSPARRKVFDEVAAFFKALRQGPGQDNYNPIFYVSNGPRNFYDLVKKYLRVHKLPKGPILLRDFGIPYKLHARSGGHKAECLERILRTFPKLPFILIGDSGEKDPYIYHEIARLFPDQIKAIYIRDVQHARRRRRLQKLYTDITKPSFILFENYTYLAQAAAEAELLNKSYFFQLVTKNR
ncbi:MAG: App1 family protein [Saprospiraceae bacterium]